MEDDRQPASQQERGTLPTLVLGLEVGGDQRWDLTSDPCAERLGGFSFIVLDHLDLRGEGLVSVKTGSGRQVSQKNIRHRGAHTKKLSKQARWGRGGGVYKLMLTLIM